MRDDSRSDRCKSDPRSGRPSDERAPDAPSVGGTSRPGEFVAVADADAFTEGSSQSFRIGDRMVAVFLAGGTFYAIEDVCPHMGAPLAGGAVQDGCVACAWHGWRFRLSDGTWCDNPKLGIRTFPVRVAAGRVEVLVGDEET